MARQCQVCAHPRVYLIHERLLSGVPVAQVAREFGLERNALMRHRDKHMPDMMREATREARAGEPARLDVVEGEILLGQAAEVYEKALSVLNDLEKPGKDQRARVSALREVRACLEFLAKLNFTIEDRGRGKVEKSESPAIDAAIQRALEERLGIKLDPSAARSEGPAEPLMLNPGELLADEVV